MATDRWWSRDTVAVVTGSNKGLGFGVVCEFARRGLTVVLTARDSHKGLAAVQSALELLGPEDAEYVHFHQLDITDAQSVGEFAAWLRGKFSGFDILINNAAINKYSNTFEDAVVTIETNYFGVKRVTEALLPLLRSDSSHGARIVNVSSRAGRIQAFKDNQHLQEQIEQAVTNSDTTLLDSLATNYLQDEKTGTFREKFVTDNIYQYRYSKLFLNTFTRILAGQVSSTGVLVAGMCPGGVDTDMAREMFAKMGEAGRQWLQRAGVKLAPVEEGGKGPVWLALMSDKEYPHGKFFIEREESSF